MGSKRKSEIVATIFYKQTLSTITTLVNIKKYPSKITTRPYSDILQKGENPRVEESNTL